MRFPALASATLLVALAKTLLAAPQQTVTPAQAIVVPVPSGSCPVGFTARRQSVPERVAVGDTVPTRRSGQGVTLSLLHPTSNIRSAEVIVQAASNRLRTLPLTSNFDPSAPDLSRTFHLSGSKSASLLNADLWLEGAGSILFVDLLSVTYADGSVWNHTPGATCRAIPNGYMLVSSR